VFDEATDVDFLIRSAEFFSAAQVAGRMQLSQFEFVTFCGAHGIDTWPRADLMASLRLSKSQFLFTWQHSQIEQHLKHWREFPSAVEVSPGWMKDLLHKDQEMRVFLSKLMRMAVFMSLKDTAKKLGIGLTAMKVLCRKYGVKLWPHRSLAAICMLGNSPYLVDKDKHKITAFMKTWDADPMSCMSPLPCWVGVLKRKHYKNKNKRRIKVAESL